MPEKLRFGGALAVVLLLLFAARFRVAISIEQEKNRIILIHITDARCGELVVSDSYGGSEQAAWLPSSGVPGGVCRGGVVGTALGPSQSHAEIEASWLISGGLTSSAQSLEAAKKS